MRNPGQQIFLTIEGYEISLTFAETENHSALGQVKQILLSSFTANTQKSLSKGILDEQGERRYNISGGNPHVP